MKPPTPPADSSSLLVPVHLDAWVADSQTTQMMAVYTADYTRLPQFKSLLGEPFQHSTDAKPTPGVHLHWALPDALTHGRTPTGGGDETVFPLVPNRWLVARFDTPKGGPWRCRLWVVESDYAGGGVGTTAGALPPPGATTPTSVVKLAAASALAVEKGDNLQLVSPDGTYAATVVAAADAPKGSAAVSIQPYDFGQVGPDGLAAGSTVHLLASSSFLNPDDPSSMNVSDDETPVVTFDVNLASIGKRHDIASWEASGGGSGGSPLFLQAVGPGNVSFAAYMPTVRDVFSFIDTELPAEGTGVYAYTYMVVGWYSNPAEGDPLRGVSVYDANVWGTEDEWQGQTPAERMSALLSYLRWSVRNDDGTPTDAPPPPLSTSLYHGLVAGVSWPSHVSGSYPDLIDRQSVHVAVGNTSADALAALVRAEACAQAAKHPDQKSAWTGAGDTLAQLMQAAMYDLLGEYDKPGGAALVRQQVEQAWFGSAPGGTVWEVVGDSPQSSDESAAPVRLTPPQAAAVNKVLAALNTAQVDFDENARRLQSLQAELYRMWWKVGRAQSYQTYGGWDAGPLTLPDWSSNLNAYVLGLYPALFDEVWRQYCVVGQAQAALPDPTPADPKDPRAPDNWAEANAAWLFPDAGGNPGKLTLAGLGLKLKASAAPNFWHPNDPVLMVSGLKRSQRHGEDGRYNDDGTLTCRVPGQTVSGVRIQGQPAIDTQTVTKGGVNLSPCGHYATVPGVASLLAEAFFVDPSNAQAIAAAVPGADPSAVRTAITDLLAQTPSPNTSWVGTPPAPFSVQPWEMAWAPLFLEWDLQYFPTGQDMRFSPSDWQFDGEEYVWLGTGLDVDNAVDYRGRALLTPQAPLTFGKKIGKYLKDNPDVESEQLALLLKTVADWDILSQTLSGLTDQLVTLVSQETFPPPPGKDPSVPCPAGGETRPSVAALVGNQYHSAPVVETTQPDAFFPVRAGLAQFQSLSVVDAFGQVYGGPVFTSAGQQSVWVNTGQGFCPTLGRGLVPSPLAGQKPCSPADGVPYGSFQLPPRVVQGTRLDVNFLAGDGSGGRADLSDDPNPVCGWLLPNHLDGGIAVYDAGGILLGELLALPPGKACDNWRPRPGDPGRNPPPACPADIPNAALRQVVESIAAQSKAAFEDLLTTIDETLWMVDPLGGRKDQFLSVLMGRPLAVVQTELKLTLQGEPIFNQYWDKMVTPPDGESLPEQDQQPPYTRLKDTGGVLDLQFPVRLGSLELRDDGLIGYYFSAGADAYKTFYAVHYPDDVTGGETYLRRIVNPAPGAGAQPYQGDIFLKCDGTPVTVTMLVDPRGSVHAYTGVLPVAEASLPGQLVEEFIRGLQVTFRTGPVIADPGTLRIPQPAEQHGVWDWIQAVAPPTATKGTTWEQDTIVDADDQARMPDAQLQIREGWLRLSDVTEPGG